MRSPTTMQGTAALLVAPSGKPMMSRRTLATKRINDAHPAGHALRMPANNVLLPSCDITTTTALVLQMSSVLQPSAAHFVPDPEMQDSPRVHSNFVEQ